MATITTLNPNDSGAVSRGTINTNLTNLNTDKAELASPAFTGNPTAPTQAANNNSTRLATTAYVDNAASTVTIETTAGVTHSLTTIAGQRVIVWAKGNSNKSAAGGATVTLRYNGVVKDTVVVGLTLSTSVLEAGFSLMYTETPGAGTQNITVITDGGTLTNVRIIVQIIS